ncbi:hypothetical protein PVAP13_9KG033300 [Panicum virgatum]|uniref:Uncharacterized protein n=1 Tax=Panicum virgatum TaxID=38727 RepID=A0A8T0NHL5_PANVG|nr:hypothetical protein PVAP13_9KG033300 [Panicum virgatum]
MTASARAGRRSEEGRTGRLAVSQVKGRHTGSPAGRRERGAEERRPAEHRRREELAEEEERAGQLAVSQVKGRRCESGAAERSAPRRAGGGGSQERGCRARAWRRNRRKAWGGGPGRRDRGRRGCRVFFLAWADSGGGADSAESSFNSFAAFSWKICKQKPEEQMCIPFSFSCEI